MSRLLLDPLPAVLGSLLIAACGGKQQGVITLVGNESPARGAAVASADLGSRVRSNAVDQRRSPSNAYVTQGGAALALGHQASPSVHSDRIASNVCGSSVELLVRGRFAEARRELQKLSNPSRACLQDLAWLHYVAGEFQEALRLYERIVELYAREGRDEHDAELLGIWTQLANVYRARGDYAIAEMLLAKRQVRHHTRDEERPTWLTKDSEWRDVVRELEAKGQGSQLTSLWNWLAGRYLARGDDTAAEVFHRKAERSSHSGSGDSRFWAEQEALRRAAREQYREFGDLEFVEAMDNEEHRKRRIEQLGLVSLLTEEFELIPLINEANVLAARHEYRSAEDRYHKALSFFDELPSWDDRVWRPGVPDRTDVMWGLAVALIGGRNYGAAQDQYLALLVEQEETLGDHPATK